MGSRRYPGRRHVKGWQLTALVGAAGVVVTLDGQPLTVMSFTITDGKVTGIDAISDPGRVRGLAATVLPDGAAGA